MQSKDPTLTPGWAYFVNNAPYADFIKDYVDQDEVLTTTALVPSGSNLIRLQIRTCVSFQALLNMLMKRSKGLRATGIAAVSCARHQLFRPLGIGDLQKGERYVRFGLLA
jgi:hypothetical protein